MCYYNSYVRLFIITIISSELFYCEIKLVFVYHGTTKDTKELH